MTFRDNIECNLKCWVNKIGLHEVLFTAEVLESRGRNHKVTITLKSYKMLKTRTVF